MSAAIILKPRGRPSSFSDEISEEICRRLSLGESLAAVCRDPEIPCERVVYQWLEKHTDFAQQYARAREQQAERFVDELVELADSARGQPGRPADHAEVQAMRLAIDTRKWAASKLLPKKYGDRIGVESSGTVTVKIVQGLGDE